MAASKLPRILGPQQLAEALAVRPEIRLLDVRTVSEFERRHIAGSYNVPLDQLERFATDLGRVRAPIVLVCRSGARARTAEDVLRRACGRNLHILDGGLLAWRGQRQPVEGRPLSPAAILRRIIGLAGIVAAAILARENPLAALFSAFLGVRLALGQSVLPCAAMGACAVPGIDTTAVVHSLVAGTRPGDAAGPESPGETIPAVS